jgi:signal transduction histidine kinase
MINNLKNRLYIGLWLIILLATVIVISRVNTVSKLSNEITIDVSELLEKLEKEALGLKNQIVNTSPSQTIGLLEKWKNDKWYYTHFENDSLRLWNSNKIDVFFKNDLESGQIFYRFGDDFYAVFVFEDKHAFAFRLANDGILHQKLNAFNSNLKNFNLSEHQNYFRTKLVFIKNPYVFKKVLWSFIVLGAIIFIGLLLYLSNPKTKRQESFLIALLLLNASFLFLKFNQFKAQLCCTEFYFLTEKILFFFLTVAVCVVILKYVKSSKLYVRLFFLLLFFLLFNFVFYHFFQIIQASQFPLDFEQLNFLTFQSFLVVVISISLFTVYWYLLSKLNIFKSHNHFLITVGLMVFGTIVTIVFSDYLRFTVLVFTLSFIIINSINLSKNTFRWLRIASIAIFSTWFIQLSESNRERVFIDSWANSIMENRDTIVEKKLLEIESDLVKLFTTPRIYGDDLSNYPTITENVLEQLYFSQYLDRYELVLIPFNKKREPVGNNILFEYEELNDLYHFHSDPTLSNYFYRVKDPRFFHGYIVKLEDCVIEEDISTTFLLVKPRLYNSENFYPETFENDAIQKLYAATNYSIGIYYLGELISKVGHIGFPLRAENLNPRSKDFLDYNYNHRFFENENGFEVVISDRKRVGIAFIALLFISALSTLLITFLGYLLPYLSGDWTWQTFKSKLFNQYYLRSQIMRSIFIVLFAAMVLSSYFLIRVTKDNYQEKQLENLTQLVTTISRQIAENEIGTESILKDSILLQLRINQLSKSHGVDLNVYGLDGSLLSTSENWIYKNEVLTKWMNFKVFNSFQTFNPTQLIVNEELEGTNYVSAYSNILDEDNNSLAYVNVPLFPSKLDINKQISSILVNFVNSYFFILLLGIFVAYFFSLRITNPIRALTEKLASTEITGKNERLEYDRDDEIGTLVNQYNQMVEQLQYNIKKLADSEREMAWREMAQQVAHEIKNPLTPMKLSLQHLQRAAAVDGPEILQKKYEKTSQMLIKQIDALTNMASEFSNFAKLPDVELQHLNTTQLLEDVVVFFQSNESVNIDLKSEKNLWTMADKNQLERVFNNIIINAIQAVPDSRNAFIKININSDDNMIKISIADNGVGIEQQFANKIFVPNFSTKTSGMGLGLAICKKIIENIKGTISFETEVGNGTTFNITLPRVDASV